MKPLITFASAALVAWLLTCLIGPSTVSPSAAGSAAPGEHVEISFSPLTARQPDGSAASWRIVTESTRGGAEQMGYERRRTTPTVSTGGLDPRRPKGEWEPAVPAARHLERGTGEGLDAIMAKAGHRFRHAVQGRSELPPGFDAALPADGAELRRWMRELSPEDDHDFRPSAQGGLPGATDPVEAPQADEKQATLLAVRVLVTSATVSDVNVSINGRDVGKTPVEFAMVLSRGAELRVVGSKRGRAREVHQIRLGATHAGGAIRIGLKMPADVPLAAGALAERRDVTAREPSADERATGRDLPRDQTDDR